MRYQAQGWNECLLASYAMLTDRPIQEIRLLVMEIEGDGIFSFAKVDWAALWGQIIIDHAWFWAVARELAARLGLPLPEPTRQPMLGTSPDLRGKGMLTLVMGEADRHVVVYEDGRIFDPARSDTSRGMPWETYQKTHLGAPSIEQIIPLKRDNVPQS